MQYSALHVFLDESGVLQGNLRKSAPPPRVVGILVFGDYGAQAKDELRNLLKSELAALGGRYPDNLHSGDPAKRLPVRKHEQLLKRLRDQLPDWEAGVRSIRGVTIIHHEDISANSGPLIAESLHDNRYLHMVCSLLEYVLGVDPEVAALLDKKARCHVYIANRRFTFPCGTVNEAVLKGQGYTVVDDRWKRGHHVVEAILSPREVTGRLQADLQARGLRATRPLANVEVQVIDYYRDGMTTSPGLYLADLFAGQDRHKVEMVAPFRTLFYGHGLDNLVRMQAALDKGDVASYLALAREAQPAVDHDPVKPALDAQEKRAAELLDKGQPGLVPYLQEAALVVDRPGEAQRGLAQAERAARILGHMKTNDKCVHAKLLVLQACISHANHTGRPGDAKKWWKEYNALETKMEAAPDDMRIFADIRNRWAVSLLDRFRYDEAEKILQPLLADQENTRKMFARRLQRSLVNVPAPDLGRCHGTLGHIFAFRGSEKDSAKAEVCFRQAKALFAEPSDQERQWVYLGHLACDRREAGRILWQEICDHLPHLSETKPIRNDGRQFQLALQLKGFIVFEGRERQEAFLGAWQADEPLQSYAAEARKSHPFDLIHQALGLLQASVWRSTKNAATGRAALKQLGQAAGQMRLGGPLLQALASIAELRRCLLAWEISGDVKPDRQALSRVFKEMRTKLANNFGPAAWGTDNQGIGHGYFGKHDPGNGRPIEEKAKCVVDAIRFNYW